MKPESDQGESKSDMEHLDYPEFVYLSSDEQADLHCEAPDVAKMGLRRLPTGKTERRIIKDNFQEIHDSAGRIRETFYNLQGALHISSRQDSFVSAWMKKGPILDTIKEKLLEVESLMAVATRSVGCSFPDVSNVETVKALNKAGCDAQRERQPKDIRVQRQRRKRDYDTALTALDRLQMPLVEAHRPNRKRISGASHQKNYARKAKKTRVPKQLHFAIKSSLAKDALP